MQKCLRIRGRAHRYAIACPEAGIFIALGHKAIQEVYCLLAICLLVRLSAIDKEKRNYNIDTQHIGLCLAEPWRSAVGVSCATAFCPIFRALDIEKTAHIISTLAGKERVDKHIVIAEYGHKKGALAAARKGDMANPKKASSGSQFYIVHDPEVCRQLDGQYTVFGEVTEGLEVIDAIASVATDRRDRPYEDVMILSIKKVEYEEPAAAADSTTVETADSTETK